MAFSAQCLVEAAIWSLLKTQHFSVDGIDKFLNMVRGSVFLMYSTADIALTAYTRFVLIFTSLLILAPLTAEPLVGMVYARDNVMYDFQVSTFVAGVPLASLLKTVRPCLLVRKA